MNDFITEKEISSDSIVPQEQSIPALENSEPKSREKSESRMDRLIEKRDMLREKYARSVANEKSAANRTKLIAEQIAKVEKEIHAEEVAKMDKFCEERKFTYEEIMSFFGTFSPEATLEDIKAMTN
jgi:hypothetical protein